MADGEHVALHDVKMDSEQEESKEMKSPLKRKRESDTKHEDAEAPGGRKSARERKSVEHFTVETPVKEEKVLVIPQGKGKLLGEIENIEKGIGALVAMDPIIGKLYRVLYPGFFPKKQIAKKNLRQFSGFPEGTNKEDVIKRLDKYEATKEIKPIAHLLDLSTSGSKEVVIARIADFLMKPTASGGEYKGKASQKSKSKKKSSTKKTKKSKKSKKGGKEKRKRSPSSFLIFNKEKRASLKAEFPDAKPTEIAKKLGEMWNTLSESEKKKYTDKAAALKAAAGDSNNGPPAKKAKKSAPAKKSADEDDEDEDEDEDDDDDDDEEEGEEEEDTGKAEEEDPSDDDKPLKKMTPDQKKLKDAVKAILKNGNYEELSHKSVREALCKTFPESTVNENKAFIRETVEELME